MSILGELIEKKDILAYIDYRTKQLQFNMNEIVVQPNTKVRQKNLERLLARQVELRALKKYINTGTLKKKSIEICREIVKKM
jgi:hypothetical protein